MTLIASLTEFFANAGRLLAGLVRGGSAAAKPLSGRRLRALAAIRETVPSQYGEAGFKRIAPGYDPNDPKLPRNEQGELTFTTCGYLPCFVGNVLNAPKCISQGGLNSMRDNGREWGAWVVADGTNRPTPLDLYGSGSDELLVHVGVFLAAYNPAEELARVKPLLAQVTDAREKARLQGKIAALEKYAAQGVKEVWETADAGQGSKGAGQRADYVYRPYDAATNQTHGISGPRRMAGWINLDKVPGIKD